MPEFGSEQMRELLDTVFAPWVQDLGIIPVSQSADGALFRVPENPALVRGGAGGVKVICGQAVAAVADTASVLALCAVNGRFRNCTTVDLTTHFLRPMGLGDVEVRIDVVSNGRRMAVTRSELRAAGAEKPAATATCAFAYLED